MYKKTIINECSCILPQKIVVSDAELYKHRKENLSVIPNYVNYAIPESWYGFIKFTKMFLESSIIRSMTIVLSEQNIADILSSRGISNNEKYSVNNKGIVSDSQKFIIRTSYGNNEWSDWVFDGKVSGFVENIKESCYGKIIIIRLSLPNDLTDEDVVNAAKKLFNIDEYKFMKGLL